jgi:hypothetical protein
MTSTDCPYSILDTLAFTRQIANYAQSLGVSDMEGGYRVVSDHLGAVLADCVLQAGLNYRTVVRTRIERIVYLFPETATLAGTTQLVERGAVSDFLMWKHSEKIERFIRLVRLLESHEIEDTQKLRVWLLADDCRDRLLKIAGIGPKTVDYLCCLVGIDCIAVDRHVKVFARDAGVEVKDYDGLKLVVSYAADLLGVSRRDFDSWIWRRVSGKPSACSQYSLF